ncbi:hypothetical protein D9M72_329040 [compost metagenome]
MEGSGRAFDTLNSTHALRTGKPSKALVRRSHIDRKSSTQMYDVGSQKLTLRVCVECKTGVRLKKRHGLQR